MTIANKEITNLEDLIDIRYVIERYEYIEDTEDSSEFEERDALKALIESCAGNGSDHEYNGEWYPVTLIRDTYFQEYAEELAEDIGAINSEATWPNNFIDWEAATEALQMDYMSVTFDGVDYWIR